MEEALKTLAHKPNLKEINQKSTIAKRFTARLKFNSLTKQIAAMKTPVTGPTSINLGPFMTKAHNWTLWFSVAILGLGYYSNVLVITTRKDAFTRNMAVIEKKYGDVHRETFG